MGTRAPRQTSARSGDELFQEATRLQDLGQHRRAFLLYLKLAKRGDSGALLNLGCLFDYGWGVRRSKKRALHYYRRAWAKGDADAAGNIGCIYRDDRRIGLAVRWFRLALAAGDEDSGVELAKVLLGRGGAVAEARALLKRAASAYSITAASQEEAALLLSELCPSSKQEQ